MNHRALPAQPLDTTAASTKDAIVLISSYPPRLCAVGSFCDEAREFIHTFGDVHLYNNHLHQTEVQLARTPRSLPKLQITKQRASIVDFQYAVVISISIIIVVTI